MLNTLVSLGLLDLTSEVKPYNKTLLGLKLLQHIWKRPRRKMGHLMQSRPSPLPRCMLACFVDERQRTMDEPQKSATNSFGGNATPARTTTTWRSFLRSTAASTNGDLGADITYTANILCKGCVNASSWTSSKVEISSFTMHINGILLVRICT